MAAAAKRLEGGEPEGGIAAERYEARAAALRLDDAFRQYLSEPSARRANLDDLGALVSGAVRLRLAAYSMSTLGSKAGERRLESCGNVLLADAGELDSWYAWFGDAIVRGAEISAPGGRDGDDRGAVVRCVSQALATGPGVLPSSALNLLWASRHLDGLWRLGTELVEPANDL